ncbi:MAG: type VI secretion system baseplate subunit TssE [Deltaproteobacteria bacterium]|jgi:type VI secretion system protein|nr:type VI secretion system baseplate subunit TssE [Deltaproteobacteria bacterium]
MRDERLLERIRNIELNPDRREGRDTGRRINSILNHLQRVLNTKQGSTPIADDYGIPDFTNMPGAFSTGATQDMERIIKHVIERYEPRLAKVRATFKVQEDDVLALRFEIDARLADENIPVTFETVVDAGGKITIKE